jgi:hypothetical protein
MTSTFAITAALPDLVNGDLATITPAAPRSSVAPPNKWAHIKNMTPDGYYHGVEWVIRAQFAQLMTGTATTATDAEKAVVRDNAIIIGSIRAGAAFGYRLTSNDITRAEAVGTGSVYTPAVPAAGATPAVPATVAADTGNGTAQANWTVAQGMAAITEEEAGVVNTLLFLGLAVPVLQGISLIQSGHHYLPTTQKIFAGTRKQVIDSARQTTRDWVAARGAEFANLAFHTACHPINPALKRRYAKNADIGTRLRLAGLGAAAIRIPALPSDAQGGKAAIAVMQKAGAVVRAMKHTITWDQGEALIRAVETAAEGEPERGAVSAVQAWLVTFSADVAFCSGIVQYLAEQSTQLRETTLDAFSIKKIMADRSSDVTRGRTYARGYRTQLQEAAEKGTFPDPSIKA